MSRLQRAVAALTAALERHKVRSALVGGLAVSARAEPRLTRDVDLAVAVKGNEGAERLVHALVGEGFSVTSVVEQEATARLATVRVKLPGEKPGGVVGDLLFASSGIESLIVSEAEPVEVFSGLVVRVARVGHLIALKLLSRDDRTRPQDRIDLTALVAVASTEEIARAKEAIRRIEEAGCSRGRNLAAALEEWLGDRPH